VLTNSFGLYSFGNVLSGQQYVLRVVSKNYRFSQRSLFVQDSVNNINFTGLD
jgi:hypothetical protein